MIGRKILDDPCVCHAFDTWLTYSSDVYYVASKPITLSFIFFVFIEMKFIHCHYCVMFAMKSMSICND